MKRTFIETPIFKQLLDQMNNSWLELNIKSEILKDPHKGSVISGTGGIRKIRIANKKGAQGKSGSYRVLYFDIQSTSITYLILIYKKSDIENISTSEKKKLKQLTEALKNEH